MSAPFAHPEFRTYDFEHVPIGRDVFLMDEYEAAFLGLFNGEQFQNVGYISYAAVRSIGSDALQVSWYANRHDRFHEVSIILPRDAFVACVGCPNYDEKPHIFVESGWLSGLHLRPYSAFALVDAIGVKAAIASGQLADGKLVRLRDRIDSIAEQHPEVAFVSFADSLLLKVNWFIGQYDSIITYSYDPETLVRLIPTIADAYQDVIGLAVYAVMTQGVNEYEDSSLLHRSAAGNHISLNSLGVPFAQLLSIDDAVRKAIKNGTHPPKELYIDEHFYHSLRYRYGFEKHAQMSAPYLVPISNIAQSYFCLDLDTILSNLEPERSDQTGDKT